MDPGFSAPPLRPMWSQMHAESLIRGLSRRPDPDKITAKESERVSDWSYQRRSCAQSKFLVFEPPSHRHGLGSMLEVTATAFRYALCLDRILILNPIDYAPTLKKWAMPGCEGNPWECYFRPLSGCSLTPSEVTSAPVSSSGFDFDAYPLRYTDFSGDLNYWHFSAFMGPTKAPWASQFLRFLMRPRPWFAEALMQYAHAGMRSPLLPPPSSAGDTYTPGAPLPLHFPQKFLSLHIRYGMKVVEQELQPVTRYMALISRKLPHLSDIFVSTESEFAINELIS
ncbi:hypothetical protein B484DRAFT_404880 [Ochromonadaceae sp. CCMP2298]|nr:hypothetical protein B484DRAFT_404880 [Ochromonadaceae sp. CCMP2298]